MKEAWETALCRPTPHTLSEVAEPSKDPAHVDQVRTPSYYKDQANYFNKKCIVCPFLLYDSYCISALKSSRLSILAVLNWQFQCLLVYVTQSGKIKLSYHLSQKIGPLQYFSSPPVQIYQNLDPQKKYLKYMDPSEIFYPPTKFINNTICMHSKGVQIFQLKYSIHPVYTIVRSR